MSIYNLKRFASVDSLKSIRKENLSALLAPHGEYFASRGVSMPDGEREELDYEGLVGVFVSPDEKMPEELVHSLYYIHEMSTAEEMDKVLKEIEDREIEIDLPDEPTPADVAVLVWLQNPSLLEKKHAERYLWRRRVFEYFQAKSDAPIHLPTDKRISEVEAALDDWFEKKKRGRDCRVFMFPKKDEIWFLVRHGEPFKREGALQEGESSSVFYRPEKHDVIVYDKAPKELRINAGGKGEKDLYRRTFGLYLFGDEQHFPGAGKYTLDTLKNDGEAAIVCSDIEGMEWVKLKEIHYCWGGSEKETEIRKADDIFEALKKRNGKIPDRARIGRASFLILFSDSKTPRTVTIRTPDIAEYTRDDDSVVVEAWLNKRGFIIQKQEADDGEAEEGMASA